MTTQKTGDPDASQLSWSLRLSILTYLGFGASRPDKEIRDPHEELAHLYIDVGNLLRVIAPLIESDNDGPPTGRHDTLRDLWPWYRERGLHVIDSHRKTRPALDPHSEVMHALSRIIKQTEGGAQ